MEAIYTLARQRTLTISELRQAPCGGRVVMVPAYSAHERATALEVAASLIAEACPEICCIGPEAEALHDDIDVMVESGNNLDMVTTWHTDAEEGVEYFVHGAAAQQHSLLALVAAHPELVKELEQEIRGMLED